MANLDIQEAFRRLDICMLFRLLLLTTLEADPEEKQAWEA